MPLGLYVSRCRGRLTDALDAEAILRDAAVEAEVAEVVDDFFEPATQERIVGDVASRDLDSVVLAGNSAEHFTRSLSGRYLTRRIVDAGISPNRIVSANLLEQVAMTHPDNPDAHEKACALVRVAAIEAMSCPPVEVIETPSSPRVLVLGLTVEGLVAAQRLLGLGYEVVMADRSGGSDRAAKHDGMVATAAFVLNHPRARFVDHARVVDGSGWAGDFEVVLDVSGERETVSAGGILLAEPHRTEWVEELRPHFKLDVDDEGRARALDPATHPAETVDPGIMVVPVRRSDAPTSDKVTAADCAAMALALTLAEPTAIHYVTTSSVDEEVCGACASCVKTCAFGACSIGPDNLSHVDPRRCRGCGKCVVSCPVGARDVVVSPHAFMMSAIRELADAKVAGGKVLGFLCGGCGYPAADAAGHIASEENSYPPSFLPLRIPCGGRLDALYVLESFKAGFDGVAVFRCREGHCHNLVGNLDMDRRVNLLRAVLRSRGMDDSRLQIVDIAPYEGAGFVQSVNDLFDAITSVDGKEGSGR